MRIYLVKHLMCCNCHLHWIRNGRLRMPMCTLCSSAVYLLMCLSDRAWWSLLPYGSQLFYGCSQTQTQRDREMGMFTEPKISCCSAQGPECRSFFSSNLDPACGWRSLEVCCGPMSYLLLTLTYSFSQAIWKIKRGRNTQVHLEIWPLSRQGAVPGEIKARW